MYIVLTISSTTYSFQKHDESGTNIGSADVFLLANYYLDWSSNPDNYQVWQQGDGITVANSKFPPVATYPKRLVLITNPVT